MQSFLIVLLCIGAAVLYGIVHDQITARICVEYFTVGHPPIYIAGARPIHDPTTLGIVWGVIATWWVGVIIGIPLAIAARGGELPKRSAGSLVRPLAKLLAIMGALAALAGVIGWLLARSGALTLDAWFASQIPPEHHVGFIVDIWAHLASYLSGFVGGILLIRPVRRSRKELLESLH